MRSPAVDAIESLPGFVGWTTDENHSLPGAVFNIGCWGLRRYAAFDHELTGSELDRAMGLLELLPKEYDPIAEMRIEVYEYFVVTTDVAGLHLAPALWEKVCPLLDPRGDMGMVGLANMAVSRVRRALVSVEAARALMKELTALRLACALEAKKTIVTPGVHIADEGTVEREVARRRAHGGELFELPCSELLASLFDGYDI